MGFQSYIGQFIPAGKNCACTRKILAKVVVPAGGGRGGAKRSQAAAGKELAEPGKGSQVMAVSSKVVEVSSQVMAVSSQVVAVRFRKEVVTG